MHLHPWDLIMNPRPKVSGIRTCRGGKVQLAARETTSANSAQGRTVLGRAGQGSQPGAGAKHEAW